MNFFTLSTSGLTNSHHLAVRQRIVREVGAAGHVLPPVDLVDDGIEFLPGAAQRIRSQQQVERRVVRTHRGEDGERGGSPICLPAMASNTAELRPTLAA